MTIPYIPGWGDTLRRDLPEIGKSVSGILNPAQDIMKFLAMNPQAIDAYILANQANPDLARQLGGQAFSEMISRGNVTTPTQQNLDIGKEKVAQSQRTTQLLGDEVTTSGIRTGWMQQMSDSLEQNESLGELLAFAAPQNLIGANPYGIRILKNQAEQSDKALELLNLKVNDVIKGRGLPPFDINKMMMNQYSPEVLSQYMEAAGPGIENQIRVFIARMAADTSQFNAQIRSSTGNSNFDDMMRALTARNTAIDKVERQLGGDATGNKVKPALYRELNALYEQRDALAGQLGLPTTGLRWVEKPSMMGLTTKWVQEVVESPTSTTSTVPNTGGGENKSNTASISFGNVIKTPVSYDASDPALVNLMPALASSPATLTSNLIALKANDPALYAKLPAELKALTEGK